jgi:heptose I phosphotransferase
MHAAGVNHRDYFFVHIRVGARDKLFITDLNRADLRKVVPERWIVKDLAALHFSAPAGVSSTDRARFMRAYTGKRLRESRAMIRAITRKAERMQSHTRKKVQAGEANYHLPG